MGFDTDDYQAFLATKSPADAPSGLRQSASRALHVSASFLISLSHKRSTRHPAAIAVVLNSMSRAADAGLVCP